MKIEDIKTGRWYKINSVGDLGESWTGNAKVNDFLVNGNNTYPKDVFAVTCEDGIDCAFSADEFVEEIRPDYEQFIEKIVEISKEYGYSISHEDYHGTFIIKNYDEKNIEWLKEAEFDGE